MKARITAAAAAVTLSALGGGAIAVASDGGASASGSRLDDGKQLVSQAKITEGQAIAAAQTRASGALNEVDLEHASGRLVFNVDVDVGAGDVKVDAATGQVLSVDADD
jgi:uncharacterized membrane protein YkoI